MDIKLEPKYEIGQKVNEEVYIENNISGTKELYVSNIYVNYNFKNNEIVYSYEFSFVENDYIYKIITL